MLLPGIIALFSNIKYSNHIRDDNFVQLVRELFPFTDIQKNGNVIYNKYVAAVDRPNNTTYVLRLELDHTNVNFVNLTINMKEYNVAPIVNVIVLANIINEFARLAI